MKRTSRCSAHVIAFAALAGVGVTGCGVGVGGFLADLELRIIRAVDLVQTEDPRTVVLPPSIVERGDTIIIREDVEVIVSIREQLVIETLPDITLLGFENLTGFDIYLTYLADGVVQQVFVFDGETLLLEYFCLDSVQLLVEEDYNVFGEFVQSFDLFSDYFNPEDFFCGEALIITLDAIGISASIEVIFLTQ
jgi:hypothetical protein